MKSITVKGIFAPHVAKRPAYLGVRQTSWVVTTPHAAEISSCLPAKPLGS